MKKPDRRPTSDSLALHVVAVAFGAALIGFAVTAAVAACVAR